MREPRKIKLFALILAFWASACSQNPASPKKRAVRFELTRIQERLTENGAAVTDKGQSIRLQKNRNGIEETQLQAIVPQKAWDDFRGQADSEQLIRLGIQKFGGRMVGSWPDFGYFLFAVPVENEEIAPRLKNWKLPFELLLEPSRFEKAISRAAVVNAPEGFTSDWNYFRGTGLFEFLEEAEATVGKVFGEGIKIGIVDSGISSNHPAFLHPNGKDSRIEKIYDFTREGDVFFDQDPAEIITLDHQARRFRLRGETLGPVAGLLPIFSPPQSFEMIDVDIIASEELYRALSERPQELRLGWLEESRFQTLTNFSDINGNASNKDRFLVLQFGNQQGNSLTFIDFSASGDFRKVRGLRDFNQSGDLVKIRHERLGISIEVVDNLFAYTMTPFRLSLVGFDPNGHGTHVASIAGGSSFVKDLSVEASPLRGMAPGAKLLIARAIQSNGRVWGAEEAILRLVRDGATWINLSFAGLDRDASAPSKVLAELLQRLSREHGIGFIVAAGNDGPASESMSDLSQSDEVLSVGAVVHPKLLQSSVVDAELGVDFKHWRPLGFSSRGPGPAYSLQPKISAPGLLLAAFPMTQITQGRAPYQTLRGTSMAAPVVTGALALLDAYQRKRWPKSLLSHSDLIRVLMQSAEAPQENKISWIDVGMGMLRLDRALRLMESLQREREEFSDDRESRIQRQLFSPKDPERYPERVELQQSAYLNVGAGERHCRSLWVARSPRADLPGDLFRESLEEIATTMETYEIEWLSPAAAEGVLDWSTLDGDKSRFWKNIGMGAEKVDLSQGTFHARPENRMKFCIDGDRAAALGPGLHGFLLKLYQVSRASGSREALPFAIFPVTVEIADTSIFNSDGPAWTSTLEAPLGIRRNFSFPKDTLWAEVRVQARQRSDSARCPEIEASLMPPVDVSERQKFFLGSFDRFSACDPRSGTRFELKNPSKGRWSLALQSSDQWGGKADLSVALRSFQGRVERHFERVNKNSSELHWTLENLSPQFSEEKISAYFNIDGLETRASLTAATINEAPAFHCESPNEQVKSLRIRAEAGSRGVPFGIELFECSGGVQRIDEGLCQLVDAKRSFEGVADLQTHVQWGKNYCMQATSQSLQKLSLTTISQYPTQDRKCLIKSAQIGAKMQNISCKLELFNKNIELPEGAIMRANMHLIIDAGRHKIYTDQLPIFSE